MYEEALKQFESAKNQDNVTGGYARLFCDYMGIVLALFSVFIQLSSLWAKAMRKYTWQMPDSQPTDGLLLHRHLKIPMV